VCHGKEGRATPDGFFPRIAGKPQGYLYQQLRHFRDGRRNHGAMSILLANLGDDYLGQIALHFSQLDLPYAAPSVQALSSELNQRGMQLVKEGDTKLQLPACVQCHGQAMTGVQPSMPGLLGLPRDYLVAQLGAWQNNSRQATKPDCMGQIAKKLSAQDVAAVTSWLAIQPMPTPAWPAAKAIEKLPVECGSIK
jgi:cytochrome c553